jgi:ABC-type nitrate/sulfonate/bicarbonate transport system permease component
LKTLKHVAPLSPWRRSWLAVTRLYPLWLVVLAWYVVVRFGAARPMFLPSPAAVWNAFLDSLHGDGAVLMPLLLSLYRAFVGMLIALIGGIVVGLAMARTRWVRRALDPLVALAFPAPKIAFMPIFILWFGIDSISKILLVAFTCIFPIVVSTYEGAISVPNVMIWSAQALGTSRSRILVRIILPASLPYVFSGIRVALPVALITAYTAEMIGGGGGLGSALMYAQRFFDTPTVFVCIVLMLLSGVIIDHALLKARNTLLPWQSEDS